MSHEMGWPFGPRVFKDYQGALQVKSNDPPLVVKPNGTITSAVLCGDTATMTIAGLGTSPSAVYILHSNVRIEQCTVLSRTDTTVVASCPNAAVGDKVIVGGGGLPVSKALTSCQR